MHRLQVWFFLSMAVISYCNIGSILNLDNYSRVIVFKLKYSLDLIDISPPPEQRGRSVRVAPAISEGQQ